MCVCVCVCGVCVCVCVCDCEVYVCVCVCVSLSCKCVCAYSVSVIYSKNTEVKRDPEKGPLGTRSIFRVNDDVENDQLAAEYDRELGHSDLILLCQVLQKTDRILGYF